MRRTALIIVLVVSAWVLTGCGTSAPQPAHLVSVNNGGWPAAATSWPQPLAVRAPFTAASE